eukprot:TRINITY_DN7519_c0_g2_i12.p1 TRINITY_DN7519_c0_g2~~TRINITY_DN7519_c0_g2_i12.p1  ORF type:complete len:228 (-),score=36.89 TRINITY_DN7519_c0_g2_i12:515-1198(-)
MFGPLRLPKNEKKENPRGIVFISDLGDSPAAGATGDNPFVLQSILESTLDFEDLHVTVASIWDPKVVSLSSSTQSISDFMIGASFDSTNGTPYHVASPCSVRKYVVAPTSVGRNKCLLEWKDEGRRLRLSVVITEKRKAFFSERDFQELGISLTQPPKEPSKGKEGDWVPDIIIIKSGYLSVELALFATKTFFAETPGATNSKLEELRFLKRRQPMYPLDHIDSFFW